MNYLLVPLYTRVFATGEYGVVTQMYAYVSFLAVIFTYGFETAFFRYAEKEKRNPNVYSTSLISIIGSSIFLASIFIFFSSPIANAINDGGRSHPTLPQYISWFACILALDAISQIPFAKLRQQNKALRFVGIKMAWIVVNIGLNFFFLIICPRLMKGGMHDIIIKIYDPSFGVGYVFVSNLAASMMMFYRHHDHHKHQKIGLHMPSYQHRQIYLLDTAAYSDE